MKSELTTVINEQAHALAAMSFALIRVRLRTQAKAMVKERKPVDEVIRAIQAAGLKGDTVKP